jgi:hypothetical protein
LCLRTSRRSKQPSKKCTQRSINDRSGLCAYVVGYDCSDLHMFFIVFLYVCCWTLSYFSVMNGCTTCTYTCTYTCVQHALIHARIHVCIHVHTLASHTHKLAQHPRRVVTAS